MKVVVLKKYIKNKYNKQILKINIQVKYLNIKKKYLIFKVEKAFNKQLKHKIDKSDYQSCYFKNKMN